MGIMKPESSDKCCVCHLCTIHTGCNSLPLRDVDNFHFLKCLDQRFCRHVCWDRYVHKSQTASWPLWENFWILTYSPWVVHWGDLCFFRVKKKSIRCNCHSNLAAYIFFLAMWNPMFWKFELIFFSTDDPPFSLCSSNETVVETDIQDLLFMWFF